MPFPYIDPRRFTRKELPVNQRQPIRLNRFGQGITLPTFPEIPEQYQIPGRDKPIDFTGELNKIYADRPQRLAYKQAVEEGTPEINRSGWARLGAVLAGGAEGWASGSPSRGFNLAQSSYYAPQERAEREYDKRIKNLGSLVDLEESDVSGKVRALEVKNKEFYDMRAEARAQEEANRAGRQEKRQGQLTDIQIENIIDEMEQRGSKEFTDPNTGVTVKKDRYGRIIVDYGKTELSVDEKIDIEGRVTGAREAAQEPFAIAADERATERAMGVAKETTSRALGVQEKKDTAAAARLTTRIQSQLSKGGATEEYRRSIVNLQQALIADPSLAKYVKEGPGEMLMPKGPDDYFWNPDAEDLAGIEKVKAAMLAGAPKVNNPSATTGTATDVDVSKLPKNVEGKIDIVGPDGKEWSIPPEEVNEFLGNIKGSKIKGTSATPVANAPAASTPSFPRPAGNVPIPPPNIPRPTQPMTFSEPREIPLEAGAQPPNLNLANRLGPRDMFGSQITPPTAPAMFGPGANRNVTPPALPPTSPILPRGNAPVTPPISGPAMPPVRNGMPPLPTNPITLTPPIENRAEVPGPAPDLNIAPSQESLNISDYLPKQQAPPLGRVTPLTSPLANPMRLSDTFGRPKPERTTVSPEDEFGNKMKNVMEKVQKATGLSMIVTQSRRTPEQQAKLYASGRTTKGPWKTDADGTKVLSRHQAGLAVDLTFVDGRGRPIPKPSTDLWKVLGRIAKEEGLVWGGDWKERDYGHVQLGEGLIRGQR